MRAKLRALDTAHFTSEADIKLPCPCHIPATPISNLQLPSPAPGDTRTPSLSDKLLHVTLQLLFRPSKARAIIKRAVARYLPFQCLSLSQWLVAVVIVR